MTQPYQTKQINSSGLYIIRGQTILEILETLKGSIPCAFNPVVMAVESMLAQVQALNTNPPTNSVTEAPSINSKPQSYQVVPAEQSVVDIVEGGASQ